MPRDQQKQHSDSRGKKKAERHSHRTRENKRRQAETRSRRLTAAHDRRFSDTFIDPTTGKKATKFQMHGIGEIRLNQARRIADKRDARRAFAKLTPAEKSAHRRAAPSDTRTPSKREVHELDGWMVKRVPSTKIDLSHILT